MQIPQSFINEVLARIDIIEIIKQRIELKKLSNNNYSALCPFHNEKTPSFTVSQQKQFFYCFGCQETGNAIRFLMMFDKMSFPEALHSLAEQVGLEVPVTQTQTTQINQKSFYLLEKITEFYQKELQRNQLAQDYLKKRDINQKSLNTFKIGFAPNSWDHLIRHFSDEAIATLLETGMLIKKSAKHFDRFRNRIMFPIRNPKGQTIGFGGRSLGSDLPKYLNSPETSLYHKSYELFGLYEVLTAQRYIPRIIVVEGYMDVVALHQYGIQNAVATLGTATNTNHIQRLLRYTSDLVFCFDGDAAGKRAAWKALEISLPLLRDGLKINFMFLTNNEDPDSMIRKIGTQQFTQLIDQAIPLSDYFFAVLRAKSPPTTIAGKAKLAKLATQYLSQMPKGLFQQLMLDQLEQIVGFPLDKLDELTPLKRLSPPATKEFNEVNFPQPMRIMLSLLIQNPKLACQINSSRPAFLASCHIYGADLLSKILDILATMPEQTTGSLLEYFKEGQEKQIIASLACVEHVFPASSWQEELETALNRIKELNKEQEIEALITKGAQNPLTLEEKQQLQRLIMDRPAEKG